ncbi:hypothetical protein T265_02699 [Opisthorchis viverrini]|uniref:Uncharacterized protein n=1 Tax=Opisthorchis viverrini TaxID=6198 RepID=A0A074ZV56_OPIVI|nr:hypothetical protein T265_02699 [Opisthorchis viverrini]KER31026.1 hypothetical protein T265_02699 [Opisthorchis viverrini]
MSSSKKDASSTYAEAGPWKFELPYSKVGSRLITGSSTIVKAQKLFGQLQPIRPSNKWKGGSNRGLIPHSPEADAPRCGTNVYTPTGRAEGRTPLT